MKEFQTFGESTESKYKTLKAGLLNGSVSLEEARNRLMEWDQSTLSRDAAEENLKFLLDPQIGGYIQGHPEAQEGYEDFLSFTEFHVAQQLALSGDQEEALNHFKKALESASDEGWAAYVEGTILYMEGKEIPEELIAKVESPKNAQILRDFNAGLKGRGIPSYEQDYGK